VEVEFFIKFQGSVISLPIFLDEVVDPLQCKFVTNVILVVALLIPVGTVVIKTA
jgi:hypothetical protein